MKKNVILNNWALKQIKEEPLAVLLSEEMNRGNGWLPAKNGLQVQEVLYHENMLGEEVLLGHTESAQWIAEKEWIYRCEFEAEENAQAYLFFGGIDTVADIYLNGEKIAFHEDMFLPLKVDVTGRLKGENQLAVYFYSPYDEVKKHFERLPLEQKKLFDNISVIRKCCLDFGDFGGVKLTTVGLFEDVVLCYPDVSEIDFTNITMKLNDRYDQADISVSISLCSPAKSEVQADLRLFSPNGELAAKVMVGFSKEDQCAEAVLTVHNPELWWPKNYGDQPLYRLKTVLLENVRILDEEEKTVGIRNLEKTGDMCFRVNHKEIKLWGGNMVPMYGFTHRWDTRRCEETMLRIDNSNMNCLRIWGGGMPYGNSFYELCDQMGIMVYQDFYLNWAYYPDEERIRALCRQEAEYHVKRLKHHPCILLWSGGNETYMHHEECSYQPKKFGYKLFKEDFAQACQKFDPDRFYLTSSPAGGDYPSDPSEGDGHPLYYTYRHSVEKYPVFVSESARTSTGPLRSLKRFMQEEEIWPEGYVNQVTYPSVQKNREQYFGTTEKFFVPLWKNVPIPDTWAKWSANFFAGESAAIEKFYEAHDAESLVYRYNAAYADFMKTYSEGVRRGKPHYDLTGKRRANGYLLWKINDTWPQFYCSLIDYFLETYIPYYQVKRSFSPVLLSFEIDDHILLWGVNDTAKDITGTLTIRGFSMSYNKVMAEYQIPVQIRSGESKVLTDLDKLCPIIREWALFAELTADDRSQISRSDTFIELERYLSFPEASISLSLDGEVLTLKTDRFAHCVELTGNLAGDEFGWLFDDNYFNLFPFEEKKVRILKGKNGGKITAKAHYSSTQTEIDYK
ncbi:glycoside hydrolase family 2 protein [Massiliimalia timonensis]|uniref:glycoside hydrolase family 2 protein n=1 Tax=Massiliimalia timonensis TaxID=1987501 RepID=UPI00189EBF74|nr:glycoside hydrolase family 2 TIM barrel-domain containing protein [Massiliimalia timonensis]